MGCDICYINYVQVDQNDMDNLFILFVSVYCQFIMGILGFDDIMLNYQIILFYDVLYICQLFGVCLVLEFDVWLKQQKIFVDSGNKLLVDKFFGCFVVVLLYYGGQL